MLLICPVLDHGIPKDCCCAGSTPYGTNLTQDSSHIGFPRGSFIRGSSSYGTHLTWDPNCTGSVSRRVHHVGSPFTWDDEIHPTWDPSSRVSHMGSFANCDPHARLPHMGPSCVGSFTHMGSLTCDPSQMGSRTHMGSARVGTFPPGIPHMGSFSKKGELSHRTPAHMGSQPHMGSQWDHRTGSTSRGTFQTWNPHVEPCI